jgi:hypothetical protein
MTVVVVERRRRRALRAHFIHSGGGGGLPGPVLENCEQLIYVADDDE